MLHDVVKPSFIIGGAPRSGTTFLCHALDKHPAVYLAKPFVPEPKVFLGQLKTKQEYVDRYATLFANAPPGATLGEKTTNYFESEQASVRINQFLPGVKMIFIVREPVARAYSNFLWSTLNGIETLTFTEAIAMQGTRADPMPPEKSHARPFDYIERGDYARFARNYYVRMGPKNVRFFLYEKLLLNPGELLNEVQEFIGIEQLPFERLRTGVVNSARDVGPPIDRQVEAKLRLQMTEKVRDFAELTGLDISLWNYHGV